MYNKCTRGYREKMRVCFMEKKLFRVFLVACFMGLLVEQACIDSQQSTAKMEKQLSSLEKHEKHETQQAVYFNEEEKKNKEEKQYKAILGGLKYVVEEKKLQFIKSWHHQVFQMQWEIFKCQKKNRIYGEK